MSTTQNETVGITQTVRTALNSAGYGSYISYAGPVIEALTARENDLAEKLIDYAVDAGADADEVKQYMRQIGLIVPATEEDPDPMFMDADGIDDRTRTATAGRWAGSSRP